MTCRIRLGLVLTILLSAMPVMACTYSPIADIAPTSPKRCVGEINAFSLDGSGSYAVIPGGLSYTWTASGDGVAISGANTATPTVQFSTSGITAQITLTVMNSLYLTDSASIQIEVLQGSSYVYVNDATGDDENDGSQNSPLKTIQEGIYHSNVGGTVEVLEGDYVENIHFWGKNITVTSYSGTPEPCLEDQPNTDDIWDHVAATTIWGGNNGSVVTYQGTEDNTCILRGFTIENGLSSSVYSGGGGICGNGTEATITHCLIQDNSALGAGGGIYRCNGEIAFSKINANCTYLYGGGLYQCNGSVNNCLIWGNHGTTSCGGLYECDCEITNCTIVSNPGGSNSPGLWECTGSIVNCIIRDNGPTGFYQCIVPTYSCIESTTGLSLWDMISCWHLDETTGTSAADSFGDNDGDLEGNPSWSSGQINNGLTFDGSGDYVEVDYDASLHPQLPVTISAWINLSSVSTATSQAIFYTDTHPVASTNHGIGLGVLNSDNLFVSFGDGTSAWGNSYRYKAGETELEVDTWYHVVGVIRGATDMDLYINGENDGGTYGGNGGALAYSETNASIGSRGGSSNFFHGTIDDVAFFGRALSETEVKHLHWSGWELGYDCTYTGNLTDDPGFVDAEGADETAGTDDDDYRLDYDSPCINAGNPNPIYQADNEPDSCDQGLQSPINIGAYGNTIDAAANQAPVAQGGSDVTDDDVAVEVTLPATDLNGDSVTYTIESQPSHGVLSEGSSANTRIYTPDLNYYGPDSFTYSVSDGCQSSQVATMSIDVELMPEIFVNVNITTGNFDGTDWDNAYDDLETALSNASPGDEIWVAAGTYTPDPSVYGRNASFILAGGVALYGGFVGDDEGDIDERDYFVNETILSGDLDEDDTPSFGNRDDNCYNVVWSGNVGGSLLDGFIIEGGDNYGEQNGAGAGIFVNSDMTVRNCCARANWADSAGGGIYIEDAAVEIVHCLIEGNGAYCGGGVYAGYTTGNENTDLIFRNCTISGNDSSYYGSGICVDNNTNASIKNSIVRGNTLVYEGQGYYDNILANDSTVTVSYSNYKYSYNVTDGGNNIESHPYFVDPDNEDYHLNSVVGRWDTTTSSWVTDNYHSFCIDAGDPSDDVNLEPAPNGGRINMGYYGGTEYASKNEATGSIQVTITPQEAINEGAIWRLYRKIDTTYYPCDTSWHNSGDTIEHLPTGNNYYIAVKDIEGYVPQPSSTYYSGLTAYIIDASYAISAGSNSETVNYVAVDAVYVSTTGSDTTGTGNEGNPYATINKGLSVAPSGAKVYVKPGTYSENVQLGTGDYLEGIEGKPTISGGAGNYTTVRITGNAHIHNFVIRNGDGSSGGGMYISTGGAYIYNCDIRNNNAGTKGGGVFCQGASSNVVFSSCTIGTLGANKAYDYNISDYSSSHHSAEMWFDFAQNIPSFYNCSIRGGTDLGANPYCDWPSKPW